MVDALLHWMQINETLLWWLGALSILTFIGTLLLVPMLVARIPADYFTEAHQRGEHFRDQHPAIRIVLLCSKNLLGMVLLLAGIAMLVLPGQGILTMLIGLMLLDFPGKYELERRIIVQPAVLRAVNWMRSKARKPPLQIAVPAEVARSEA